MTYTALVVEDQPEIIDVIADVMDSLEHSFDTACSQREAMKRLRERSYSYILLDIEIPARSRTGIPRVQNTENLIEGVHHLHNGDNPPIIIMCDRVGEDLDVTEGLMRLAMALKAKGAVDVIKKPFPPAGRTLDRVIKKVLAGKVEPVRFRWSGLPAEKTDTPGPPSPPTEAPSDGQCVAETPVEIPPGPACPTKRSHSTSLWPVSASTAAVTTASAASGPCWPRRDTGR